MAHLRFRVQGFRSRSVWASDFMALALGLRGGSSRRHTCLCLLSTFDGFAPLQISHIYSSLPSSFSGFRKVCGNLLNRVFMMALALQTGMGPTVSRGSLTQAIAFTHHGFQANTRRIWGVLECWKW